MSDSDEILKKLFDPKPLKFENDLSELFERRISLLNISKTSALKLMGMTTRTLNGILSGSQKKLDYTQLIKLANFLGVELEEVTRLYLKKLQEVHETGLDVSRTSDVISFIKDNFNLADLKKAKIINSLTDYESIIVSIKEYFGLRNIFDYKKPNINVAYSSAKRASKNESLENWIFSAEQTFIELRNPHPFNREGLIEFFPNIRWYSTDVENGLVKVIKHLYHLGITVIMQPSYSSLHIRGATFSVNDKPCVSIADYKGFYPTIWFALIHELYHVLFDWEQIQLSDYHISEDDIFNNQSENEMEANDFAREYLFSKEKTKEVSFHLNNSKVVREYTIRNQVHPSFAYVFNAYDSSKKNKRVWGVANKNNPDFNILKRKLEHIPTIYKSYEQYIKVVRNSIYN